MNKFYKHIRKHYGKYSFIANALNATALAGFALLGLINDTMTVAWLVGWGVTFALLLGIGKLLDQEIDDLDKVRDHEDESDNANQE